MCLIVLAWRVHPELALVVAANRDEFHGRPAARAAFWDDQPQILAGRDLEARGTWMGISRTGKFAAVTNYRGATEARAMESRGALVSRFLSNGEKPGAYVRSLKKDLYSGFNLLAADGEELWWISNRETERSGEPRRLEPGIYGLGNALLDSPEVDSIKKDFAVDLEAGPAVESLFAVLHKGRILNPQYGTRCSTVLLSGRRTRYAERGFAPDGAEGDTVHFEF
ncbi:MAG TPA: NRDE family protein [Burkholderiales bacterium]|nr:NRDE family protein [Burkholderiales bacterium]